MFVSQCPTETPVELTFLAGRDRATTEVFSDSIRRSAPFLADE
jgi:hypothetical protein